MLLVFGGKEIDVPENLTVAEIKERVAQSKFLLLTKNGTGNPRTILTNQT